MGVLDYLAMTTPNSTSFGITDPRAWDSYFGGRKSSAGMVVSRDTSLGYPAVWRAVNMIADDVAKLPLVTYRVRNDGGKDKATDHPAYRLLKIKPNSEAMTPQCFKKTLTAHALLNRGGYAYIVRNGAGDPIELIILDPDRTHPVRENDRLWYVTTEPGGQMRRLLPENVLHIKGLSFDGLCGYTVVEKLQESLGLGLALQKYGSVFFKNNGRPGMVVEMPMALKDQEAVERFKRAWGESMEGLDNAHKVKLLEQGAKISQFQVKNEEAQFLQSREFEIRQIANIFGCPPHKLGDSSRVAYNSLEQENQSYLDGCLDPWLVNWEEEVEAKLLRTSEQESETHLIEFMRQALVRADLTARVNAYAVGIQNRWLLPNEARIKENMNPIEGGDEFAPVAAPQPEQAPPSEPVDDAEDDTASHASIQDMIAGAVDAMSSRIEAVQQHTSTQLVETTQRLFGLMDRHAAEVAKLAAEQQRQREIAENARLDAATTLAIAGIVAKADALGVQQDEQEQRMRGTHRALLMESLHRMTKRIGAQALKAAKRPTGYHDWLDGMRAEGEATMREMVETPLLAIEAYWQLEVDRDAMTNDYFGELHDRLLACGDGDAEKFVERVESACALAEGEVPAKLADGLILERRTYELTETAA